MPPPTPPPRDRLSPIVVRLGWVSFFTDAASEMLYPLIPLFLTVTLGAPVAAVGVVEGLADGVATGLKAVSGVVADRVRRHRLMTALGYGLSALAKPLLALAPNWGVVAGLRTTDRVGKGIRGVPRDVMIAEASDPATRGRAFGLHRAMDTAGATVGPLLAVGALLWFGEDNLRPIFLLALVPGLASLWLLRSLPKEVDDVDPHAAPWEPGRLPWRGRFGSYCVVLVVFGLGNSSDAFLLLRAKDLGLSAIEVILAFALSNLVYAAASLPVGIRGDRTHTSKLTLFGVGLVIFVVVYLGFALATSAALVWPLFAVYGAYHAFTDGIGRAVVVDLVPANVRGKALGVTQALTGAAVLVAGIGAGVLWDAVSPAAPFFVGAALAATAAAILAVGAYRAAGTRVTRRATSSIENSVQGRDAS
jgi:sugar phosphate permease